MFPDRAAFLTARSAVGQPTASQMVVAPLCFLCLSVLFVLSVEDAAMRKALHAECPGPREQLREGRIESVFNSDVLRKRGTRRRAR